MEAINLDLLPGAIPPTVHVSQGDVGRQFKIALYDGTGAAYSLTGKTLSIVGHKCDGNVFQYAIPSESISGNEVTITTEEQMTPVAGKAICEINIEQNDTKLGTCNFVMNVEKGPLYMGSLSKSELSIINALVDRAEADIVTTTAAAATATQKASEASASATAAAGSATNAATKAGIAEFSATDAANSATAAYNSANDAANSATDAANSATAAANSATEAANSATTAAASESKITNMTVSSQSVPYTQSAEVVKTEVGGAYNLDFKIPRGEPTSGHDVEANPSGAATGDLTKLGIDGTIYNVPVTSVNTKTGDVVLDGDNIDYAEGVTVNDQIGTNAANIGDISTLTTSVKSSLVGAVNVVDGKVSIKANASDVYTKTQIDSVSTATVSASIGSGNVYYKVFGNLVIVWGLINTISGIATGQAVISGLPRNMIGVNNVIKAINNDGTSADWVLYQSNYSTAMLSSIAHTGSKSYTISFSYYTN